jgi:5-oxoprolinase (ATP-hydrolysing) subunit A
VHRCGRAGATFRREILMTFAVDLNADIGESFGRWSLGKDTEIMRSVTSVNIACGYHAGDPGVMRETVRLAKHAGIAVGAHPGFPDLVGFGRRDLAATPREVENFALYQIGALAAMAVAEGLRLQHVKAHGALYTMAVRNRALADAIASAIAAFDRTLILFGPPGSELLQAGQAAGLRIAAEGFADRAYEAEGALTSRSLPGAVIHDGEEVVRRAVRMAREGVVTATDGSDVPMRVDTICTHGDTPGAHELTRRIRTGLERNGVTVRAVGAPRLPA